MNWTKVTKDNLPEPGREVLVSLSMIDYPNDPDGKRPFANVVAIDKYVPGRGWIRFEWKSYNPKMFRVDAWQEKPEAYLENNND